MLQILLSLLVFPLGRRTTRYNSLISFFLSLSPQPPFVFLKREATALREASEAFSASPPSLVLPRQFGLLLQSRRASSPPRRREREKKRDSKDRERKRERERKRGSFYSLDSSKRGRERERERGLERRGRRGLERNAG
jgi:hypothetical protein